MAAPVRFTGLHIDHPTARERDRGVESQVSIGVIVGQSSIVRFAVVNEDQLLGIIESAAKYLKVLRQQRTPS